MHIAAMAYYINTLDSQSSGRGRWCGPHYFKVDTFFEKYVPHSMPGTYFSKKVPNSEIVWPTPATPRALTVKGVYVVSHSCYVHRVYM